MPSKTRSGRKPVPRILETPIECSSAFPSKREQEKISRQTKDRLQAVYDYYGVDRKKRSSASKLIELMAIDCFPAAFERRVIGYPKTKKPKWTADAKTHLLEFMRERPDGETQEAAAQRYIKLYCQERGSAKGIVAEYHRAQKWERDGSRLTQEELDDITDWVLEREAEIRRGK
jgi:hypothetical protein